MEVKKKKQIEYNKWVSHLENSKERTNYAIRRMDLLIITISGGGIYVILESLRELKTSEELSPILSENKTVLILSGIFFLLCITLNFVSQLTGYQANTNEECYVQQELKKIENKDYDKCAQDNFNKKSRDFDKATDVLNNTSIFLMFLGLVFLAIFNYHLF
jgi:hypothetical protein